MKTHLKKFSSFRVSTLLFMLILSVAYQSSYGKQSTLQSKKVKQKTIYQINDELCGEATEYFPVGTWQKILDQILDQQGQVNYPLLQKSPLKQKFQALVNEIYKVKIEDGNPCSQLAYWLNTYNVLTIKQVLEYPHLKSVATALVNQPRYTFFKKKQHYFRRQAYSLDDIEHQLIRAKFTEPRIHFALNCASQSCPQLHSEVFRAQNLNTQLEQVTTSFINDPKRNRFSERLWKLSKIFSWYKDDFEIAIKSSHQAQGVGSFISAYLSPIKLKAMSENSKLRIEFLEYDWSLNGQSPE